MNGLSWSWALVVLLAYVPVSLAQEKSIVPDLSQLNDGKIWTIINADYNSTLEDGKRTVYLKPKGKAQTPGPARINRQDREACASACFLL